MTDADGPAARPKRAKLPERNKPPSADDVRALMAEAQRMHGCLFEQNWAIPGNNQVFVLTVIQDIGADKPIWNLYAGTGPASSSVWSAADSDLDLITDILLMFMTPKAPPPPPAEPPPPESGAAAGYFDQITPVDFQMLKQQPNILLGHLLVESGLLPEPTLDAALKLQEMVRSDSLTPAQAIEALRKAHERGLNVIESAAVSAMAAAGGHEGSQSRMVVDLVKQAGLISDDEIAAVMKITRGKGDLDQVLVAARKVNAVTMEAARACWPLVRDGRLKPEQAIIALHYCDRSMVSFEDAVRDMGWDLS